MNSIDDPKLTTKLTANQTLFVSVDAVNHVVEAATSKVASPYSITLAKETIRLVAKYLPLAIKNPDDLEARYYLLYASLLGGVSFDNGLLHYTHALEHPLSAIKHDLSHGLGLAMLLPAVVKHIYKEKYNTLSDILSPIISGLKAEPEGGEYCAKELEKWLIAIGIDKKLKDEGFTEADIEKLTELAFNTPSLGMLLGLAPNEASKQIVSTIYRESLDFYN
jgi:alcohol dehydrogenase